MKVIVVNDSDGHTNVLNYNFDNLKQLLEFFLEAGECEQEDEAYVLLGSDLDQPSNPTTEKLEEFIIENCLNVNGRGGMVHILEITDGNFSYNPLT